MFPAPLFFVYFSERQTTEHVRNIDIRYFFTVHLAYGIPIPFVASEKKYRGYGGFLVFLTTAHSEDTMAHNMNKVFVRKVLLFAPPPRLKGLRELLKLDGVLEVVEVVVADGWHVLIAAIKKHKDAAAIIVYGGGETIEPFLLLMTQQIRKITSAPILLVMLKNISRSKESDLRAAGITEILARYDAIKDREVADVFHELAVKVLPLRPILTLVKSSAISESLQDVTPLHGINQALAIAGELEQESVRLRQAAQSGTIPAGIRQTPILSSLVSDIDDPHLVIEPSDGTRELNVTLYGKRFHLTDPLCKMLKILYVHQDGVTREQMYALGIPRNPTYVSVAIANLRRRLPGADPHWQDVVKCVNGRYFLDFDRLSKSRRG